MWAIVDVNYISGHPFYVGVQYHPEYLSRPLKASAPYLGFILASTNMLEKYISRDCKLSPRQEFFAESSEEELVDPSPPPVKKSKTSVSAASKAALPAFPVSNGTAFKSLGNGDVA